MLHFSLIKRPGVAGDVLQTPLLLISSPPKPVTCHMSCVTCHISHVTYNISNKNKKKQKNGISGGASRWKVCYQCGLPRLIFLSIQN